MSLELIRKGKGGGISRESPPRVEAIDGAQGRERSRYLKAFHVRGDNKQDLTLKPTCDLKLIAALAARGVGDLPIASSIDHLCRSGRFLKHTFKVDKRIASPACLEVQREEGVECELVSQTAKRKELGHLLS